MVQLPVSLGILDRVRNEPGLLRWAGFFFQSEERRGEESSQLVRSGPTHTTREPEPPAGFSAGALSLTPVEAGSGPSAEASEGKGNPRAPDVRSNRPIWKWGVHSEPLLTLYFPIHIYCLNNRFCIFQSCCNGNSLVTNKC